MTGYVRKCEGNTTMSFKISNKQLIKKCNQIWKRVKKLLKIGFDSEPVYGDNNKYIKTKIKIYPGSMITSFQSTMYVFINNNARFGYQSKEKVLSTNIFGRTQIWTRKDKNAKSYWWWFNRFKFCFIIGINRFDSNDETEFDNDESDE